jgi:hypothetical protein
MAIRRDGFISFNPYLAGKVVYSNGTHAPTSGPVSLAGQQGYADRDRRNRVRRNALLAYQKQQQAGQYAGADYLRKGR